MRLRRGPDSRRPWIRHGLRLRSQCHRQGHRQLRSRSHRQRHSGRHHPDSEPKSRQSHTQWYRPEPRRTQSQRHTRRHHGRSEARRNRAGSRHRRKRGGRDANTGSALSGEQCETPKRASTPTSEQRGVGAHTDTRRYNPFSCPLSNHMTCLTRALSHLMFHVFPLPFILSCCMSFPCPRPRPCTLWADSAPSTS